MLHAAETTDTSIIIGVIMISYVCILAYIYSVYKVDRSFVAGVFVCLFVLFSFKATSEIWSKHCVLSMVLKCETQLEI